jgi:Flp pilus assembly protein TadD
MKPVVLFGSAGRKGRSVGTPSLSLYVGDEKAYRATCRSMLERFGQTTDRSIADRTAKTCLLASGAVENLAPVVRLADLAVAPGDAPYLHYYQLAKGMAEYRRGDLAAAVDWLTRSRDAFSAIIDRQSAESLDRYTFDEGRTTATFYLAMAQHDLGDLEQARRTFVTARDQLCTRVPSLVSGARKVGMPDWLVVQNAAREAETLIAPAGPARPTTPATRPN